MDPPGIIRIKLMIFYLRAKEMEIREVNTIFKVIFNKTERGEGGGRVCAFFEFR